MEQNKETEFRGLFMISLGKALIDESYNKEAGNSIFAPTEKELSERNKYVMNKFQIAKKEEIDLTIKTVYPFAKEYLHMISKNYKK